MTNGASAKRRECQTARVPNGASAKRREWGGVSPPARWAPTSARLSAGGRMAAQLIGSAWCEARPRRRSVTCGPTPGGQTHRQGDLLASSQSPHHEHRDAELAGTPLGRRPPPSSVAPFVSRAVCQSRRFAVSVAPFVSRAVFSRACQSRRLSVAPFVSRAVCQSRFVSRAVCQSRRLSVAPFVSRAVCQSRRLSVAPFVSRAVCQLRSPAVFIPRCSNCSR